MKGNKLAKDLAFDRERSKLKKEIRELQRGISQKDEDIRVLHQQLEDVNTKLLEKEDWIQRLLDYTEMSEEDLKTMIDKANTEKEIADNLSSMNSVVDKFLSRMFY